MPSIVLVVSAVMSPFPISPSSAGPQQNMTGKYDDIKGHMTPKFKLILRVFLVRYICTDF